MVQESIKMLSASSPQRARCDSSPNFVFESVSCLGRRAKTAAKQTATAFDPSGITLHRNKLKQVLGGACVSAASSLALSRSVAAPLVQYAVQSSATANLFQMLPWGGPLVNAVLGQAGAMSAIAVAAPLLGVATTLVQSDGPSADRMHWLLTHVGLGLAASPVWIMPAATIMGALPALCLSLACMVGISLILGERLQQRQASVQMLLAGVTLVCAGAPLPALVATGAAAAHAVTFGALMLAGGATVLAGYVMNVSFAALKNDSTADLRALAVHSDLTEEKLNVPGEIRPNVFCYNSTLLDHVQYLKQELAKGRRMDIQTVLLSGPPGTGKTAISRAIGHTLQAKTYLIKPSLIMGSTHPAQKVRDLFDQAISMGGRSVFLFDDSEVLFPNRKSQGQFDTGFDTRTLLTTTLNDCIDGIEKNRYELLLVVISTNNRSYLDDSIRQRFATCDVDILPPAPKQAVELLRALFAAALRDHNDAPCSGAYRIPSGTPLPPSVVDLVLESVFSAQTTAHAPVMAGREYAALCAMALRHVLVHEPLSHFEVPTEAQWLRAFAAELPKLCEQWRQRHQDAITSACAGA